MVRVDPTEVLTRTADPPDAVLRYGDHHDAIIDVHLPPADGAPQSPAQLVVLVHGGFWRAAYDRRHTRPLAQALAGEGLVVATPEYRRVGGAGDRAGGWPTTFADVDAAMTALPRLLEGLDVLISRVTVAGHSAGGHLALWLANQQHRIDRVVGLAPIGDLRAAARDRTGGTAVPDLLGGSPKQIPEVYDATDPATRLHARPACEIVLVHGLLDDVVPVGNSRGLVARHPDTVTLCELQGVEHYGVIDPLSPAWPVVRAALAGEPFHPARGDGGRR